MKNLIKENLSDPERLEMLYRNNRKEFEKAFLEIYPAIAEHKIAEFWKIRLEQNRTKTESFKSIRRDVLFLIITCVLAGFLIKFPAIFNISTDEEVFYIKNVGLIIFGALSFYYFLTANINRTKNILITGFVFLASAVYINLLPSDKSLNTLVLVCIHLPVMLWYMYGLVFTGFNLKDPVSCINYIKFNGELAVLYGVIATAGGILSVVTIGLFNAANVPAGQFYTEYIMVIGAVSAPVIGTFLISYFPAITSKIPPVIAGLFSPLVLLTLIIYLLVIFFSGKSLYTDRDFLLVFNVMLLGVTAIIVFSVSEAAHFIYRRFLEVILFALVVVTLITDLIALSAIIYRLGEFGFTPNRTAVFGSNLLILGNLVLFARDLYLVNFKHDNIGKLEITTAKYLPVYAVWAAVVVLLFPLIFGIG